jgi:hypothetical protein
MQIAMLCVAGRRSVHTIPLFQRGRLDLLPKLNRPFPDYASFLAIQVDVIKKKKNNV